MPDPQQAAPQIQGLPPGAIVGPSLSPQSAPTSTAGSTQTPPVQGLPPGAIVGPSLTQSAPPAKDLSAAEQGTDVASAAMAGAPVGANPLTVGVAKAGAETAHTIGRLINAATGDNISWLPTSMKQPGELESSNAGESIGKIGESIAEFALGDEALKGLSIAEKLGVAQKITEFAQNSPTLAKLLNLGLNATRGAATGAIAGGLHDGAEGAKTGAELGAAGELAAPVIGKVAEAARGGGDEASGIVKQVLKGKDVTQPEIQESLKSVGNAAEPSIRESLTQPIADARTSKEALYKAYDDAAGVDRKALQERLDNTQDQMSKLTGTAVDMRRLSRLQEAESALKTEIAGADFKAEAAGVKISDADAANVKLRALEDVEKNVFKNQEVVKGNTAQGEPEHVDVDNAIKAIQKMKDNEKFGGPRWDQAFETGSGDRILRQLREYRATGQTALTKQTFAKWLGRTAATAGGLGLLYEGGKALVE